MSTLKESEKVIKAKATKAKYAKKYMENILSSRRFYCEHHDKIFSSQKRLTTHLLKHRETKQNKGIKESYIKTLLLQQMLDQLEKSNQLAIKTLKEEVATLKIETRVTLPEPSE